MAEWLRPIPWQLFATLTFERAVGIEAAHHRLKQFLNELERSLREAICFVAGLERKPRSAGMEVPWHFHVVMTSSRPITAQLVEKTWRRLFGPGQKTLRHPEGDSAEASPFEEGRLGIQYCLKKMNDCDGDWLFYRLELFHPNIPPSGSHRVKRRKERQQQRLLATDQGVIKTTIESQSSSSDLLHTAAKLPV